MRTNQWLVGILVSVSLTAVAAATQRFVPLKLGQVRGLAFDHSGNLLVPDLGSATLYKISPAGAVETLPTAPVKHLHAVTVTPAGAIIVVETEVSRMHRLGKNGAEPLVQAAPDDVFRGATTVVSDAAGNLYIGENDVNLVRKVTPAGKISVYAGAFKQAGNQDGAAGVARFTRPRALAMDSAGNLYVGDESAHVVRKIATDGSVSTLAGAPGQSGAKDGAGNAARFSSPRGLAVDARGNVYVMDTNNHAVRKITPEGVVTTFAGMLGEKGFADGSRATARFAGLRAAAFDAHGNLFVADSDNYAVRRVAPDGTVSTAIGVQPSAL